MPRDSTATRERLVAEAERLFATQGIWQVTVREIVEAAGQKNVSALSYHFGSREGVLEHILASHARELDERRHQLLTPLDETTTTAAIVTALVRCLTERMRTESGRHYVRIVAQLSSRFPGWQNDATGGVHLTAALDLLARRPVDLPEVVRRERVVAMIMLMTSSLAERARLMGRGRRLALADADYEANLIDMLVGVITAPASLPA